LSTILIRESNLTSFNLEEVLKKLKQLKVVDVPNLRAAGAV